MLASDLKIGGGGRLIVLEIQELHKSFGDNHALRGVNLVVPAGEMFGFVGANGAGKTTTMRIVMGLLEADSGKVSWDGQPLTFALRRRFGYMPEERGLYQKMRVREQLDYFGRLRGLSAPAAGKVSDELLEQLGLTEKAGAMVESLSLGNQQRAQLAVALVQNPAALVLDEPFSGLDPIAVDALTGVLQQRAREGASVVFSSHQLELVERLCESVGIIAAGRIVASGKVSQLRSRGGKELTVVVRGPDAAWAKALPGTVASDGDRHTLIVRANGEPVDDQVILSAALAAGHVERFSWEQPSLAKVFREAVA
jgi:ABC-2 type transport system ATP-binding protein